MKVSSVAAVCSILVLLVAYEAQISMAAGCNPQQLNVCASSFTSSSKPSPMCCAKLKEQKSCLCTYARNPSLKKYLSSPNAKRVSASCGVPIPKC